MEHFTYLYQRLFRCRRKNCASGSSLSYFSLIERIFGRGTRTYHSMDHQVTWLTAASESDGMSPDRFSFDQIRIWSLIRICLWRVGRLVNHKITRCHIRGHFKQRRVGGWVSVSNLNKNLIECSFINFPFPRMTCINKRIGFDFCCAFLGKNGACMNAWMGTAHTRTHV